MVPVSSGADPGQRRDPMGTVRVELPVELVIEATAEVGESPRWDDRRGSLWWVDMYRCELHEWRPGRQARIAAVIDQPLAFVVKSGDSGWLAGVRDGFGEIDADGKFELTLTLDQPAGYRLNDGAADLAGNVWAGSVCDADPTKGILYRLDRSGVLSAVREDLVYPNGIAWSRDGSAMTLVDSEARCAERWSASAGQLAALQWRTEFPAEIGIPDGLAADTEGGVWIAMFGSGLVVHCGADGAIDGQFSVPVPNPTSVVFGGADYRDLYITTARFGMTEPALASSARSAGGIFRCRPGNTGFPSHSSASAAS